MSVKQARRSKVCNYTARSTQETETRQMRVNPATVGDAADEGIGGSRRCGRRGDRLIQPTWAICLPGRKEGGDPADASSDWNCSTEISRGNHSSVSVQTFIAGDGPTAFSYTFTCITYTSAL